MRQETRPSQGRGQDRDAGPRPVGLDCLLASYERYGVSHVWPPCLGRPATGAGEE